MAVGGRRQRQEGESGQSWGPGTEIGTEISAEGRRELLDPKIMSHCWGKALAKLLARGGGTRVAPAAGLDIDFIIPSTSPWGQHRARFSLACN